MRVDEQTALGNVKATIFLDGWPAGHVMPSRHEIPVAPRNALPAIEVSAAQERIVSVDGYSVEELRLTPDGKRLVVVLTKRLKDGYLYHYRLWDAVTGKELSKLFQIEPEPLLTHWSPFLSFSSDGQRAVIHYNAARYTKKGKDYHEQSFFTLHYLDLNAGRELWREAVLDRNVHGCVFAPDGRTLIVDEVAWKDTGMGRERKREFQGAVWQWDTTTGKRTTPLSGGPYQLVRPVEYSADGKYLVITDEHRAKQSDYRVQLWDVGAQKVKLQLTGFKGPTEGLVSPNGQRLLVCSNTWIQESRNYERDVRVWDIQTGKQIAKLPLDPGRGWIRSYWSSDSLDVFLASANGALLRWDPSGTKPLIQVETLMSGTREKQPDRDAWQRDIHPAAGLFAFGINGKLPKRLTQRTLTEDYAELPPPEIVLFNLKTMQRAATIRGHQGKINHLTFSRDGRRIISGGTDGTVRWWTIPGSRN